MPDTSIRQWREHVRALLAGLPASPADQEAIVAELAQHLEDRYRQSLAAGATEDEARRIAVEELPDTSDLIDEARRAARARASRALPRSEGGGVMSGIWQDIQYGWRLIRRKPAFSAVAVLTLALGVGANGAIFGILHAVLLRELPYATPQNLVMVWESRPREGVANNVVSPADFLDWRTRQRVFDGMAAYESTTIDLTGRGEPQRLRGGHVAASFFGVLGVAPLLGRDFRPDEETPGHHVAILDHGLWQRRFGSDPSVVGTRITLNGLPFEVIGVLPASFEFPAAAAGEAVDVWHPIDFTDQGMRARFNHFLRVVARLKPGITIQRAQQEMDRISAELQREVELQNQGHGAHVIALKEQLVGEFRLPLLMLMASVGVVLLIGCMNVANLMLARATTRSREVAVRAALGAGRARVARQLVIECLCISVLGALVATPVAIWGIATLRSFAPAVVPRLSGAGLDPVVIAFMLGVAAITGIAFGLAPAFQFVGLNLTNALKGHGLHAGSSRRALRRTLVVAEIALAFVLLVTAGLTMRSLFNLLQVETGFDGARVLTVSIGATRLNANESGVFFRTLHERVRGLPGVTSAGFTSHLPMSGNDSRSGLGVEGLIRTSDEPVRAHWRVAAFDYFRAMDIRLVEGRLPTAVEAETRASIAVINRTAATRYWPGQSPIGRRLQILTREWREIVGVVEDVRHWGPSNAVNPEVYLPGMRNPTNLVVRASGDPALLTAAIRDQIRQLAPQLPMPTIRTMDDIQGEAVAAPTFNLILFGLFAVVALLLAVVGVYGVTSYTVAQSQGNIGLRMAIGARGRDVVRLFVGEGVRLTILGLAIGAVGAFAATRIMASLLFGVAPTDPATFVGTAVVIAAVALAACYVPARRAATVDPLVALRGSG